MATEVNHNPAEERNLLVNSQASHQQPTDTLGRPVYHRTVHAAHGYFNGKPLWDLETWTVCGARGEQHPDVPANAEYLAGFVENGVQYSQYVRKAPASFGKCPRCA